MKVALDVSAVPVKLAGAGRYVYELARRLPSNDVETTLVTRNDDADRWQQWSTRSKVAPIVPSSRIARIAFEAFQLGTSRTARDAQVWHGPHYTMPRRGSTPAVVTIHDLTFFTNPEWHERSKVAFFRRAITYSAHHAKVLVAVSDFTARQIDQLIPDHAPVVVAHHGVDLERFKTDDTGDSTLFSAHSLAIDVPYILFLGTVEPRKGLDVLLKAFSSVAKSDPAVELWIAGQAGWGLDDFDAQLGRHYGSSRIRRLGYVDEVLIPALLRRARVVAYPSRGEGFGLPVLEAMACGAVVVTTAATVMEEIAGTAARLVPVGDSEALANELLESLNLDDQQRATISDAARARASGFTWDSSLRQHVVAYNLAQSGA